MQLLAYRLTILASIIWPYALAHPMVERDEWYKRPIAHVPQSLTLQSISILPKIELLKKADLLTLGTVVPGSSGPIQAITRLEGRSVIGTDDRFLQVKTGNPWDYIGSFAWQVGKDGYRCSGSLIGPRHLATARHCFETTNDQVTYTFRPNYDQGTRGYTTAHVTTALFLPEDPEDFCSSWGDDWAIMILDQRIGDKYGYFGVKQFDGTTAGKPNFWHEGYPISPGNAERPYVQQGITGENSAECNGRITGPIVTDADSEGGQSGGPLWLLPEADGVRYLYGILAGGSPASTLFAGRVAFVNAVAEARRDFP